MELKVKKLTQRDEAYRTALCWMQEWWQEAEGLTPPETEAIMERSLNEEGYPKTYGLFRGEEIIGIFQLTLYDLHVRPDIYPWLANVFIKKEERGKGYSRFLLEESLNIAKAEGIDRLWLFTHHVGLYEKYGFILEEMVDTFTKEPRVQRVYSKKL